MVRARTRMRRSQADSGASSAQFAPSAGGTILSIPVFIIAEANLGALGLGVSEPLPSLGGLVCELQDFVMLRPEPWRLAPLVVLIVVIGAFQVLLSKQEVHA